MSRVRVHNFSISLDGFGTGDVQTLENPFGHVGERLHEWMISTDAFGGTGKRGIENDLVAHTIVGVGAMIMGRNMFSPHRGPWEDASWRGWWGDNPPYHNPVFVMTHHARPSLEMEGGTTFRFVSGTPQEVLAMAREAAGDLDIQVCGGVSTVRDFLAAGLIDEAHIAVAPVVVGRGERLWDGLEGLTETYDLVEAVGVGKMTHLRLVRK